MTVVWTGPARRDLRRLSREIAARVVLAVERFATTGQGDIKRLTDAGGDLRLRVGAWRVIFGASGETLTIKRIHPRGRAYRD